MRPPYEGEAIVCNPAYVPTVCSQWLPGSRAIVERKVGNNPALK
jgi:hypothetical protein